MSTVLEAPPQVVARDPSVNHYELVAVYEATVASLTAVAAELTQRADEVGFDTPAGVAYMDRARSMVHMRNLLPADDLAAIRSAAGVVREYAGR